MAKSQAQSRSETVATIVGDAAIALAAAWRGVFHFFGGRVDSWDILPVSDEHPEGGLVANGFTVNGSLNPDEVIRDISKRNRRLEFFPAYNYLVLGDTPPEYTDPQDMTNFMVQYLKGSVEEGTAKTPEYVRQAVADYKSAHGLRTRRGPKRRIIRLDALDQLDEATIANIPQDQMDAFLALATKVAGAREAKGEVASS
jgi:hypothetical protein